jgi:hypothetical protein
MSSRAASLRAGLAALCVSLLAACATEKNSAAPPAAVPDSLRVAANQTLTLALHGAGVQIYECRAGKDASSGFAWVLKTPDADLTDHKGKTVARHYAGPTWEASDGSSKVTGELVAQDNGPDPAAIPWLLLRAASNTAKGLFAKTAFIQRLHTVGGKAPPAVCDAAQAGKRVRVPYSADYYFYAPRR